MLLPILLACAPRGDRVVAVESGELLHVLDPRFLSFAVDSGQVAGTVFWSEDEEGYEEEVQVYDFRRPELNRLAAELSPAWLRIGGTDADRLWIDLEDELEEPPEGFRGTLGGEQLEAIGDFASQHELDLFFTLNAGPSVRDEEGAWQSDNAEELIAWAADEDWPVGLWELGNELNGYALLHGSSVSGEQYARDLARLGQLRDEHTPGARIAGPSSAYWPESGELGSFMEGALEAGGQELDVVTWHFYPQQSTRCPVQTRVAGEEVMLDPVNLDEVRVWAEEVEKLAALHAPQAEVWLGESGNAQCGGSEGVSDRFAGTFWWLDQLGTLAQRGQPVVVRQTLSGSDYGLLDDETLEPTPDLWASVLFKRLVGEGVLEASSEDELLRAYAFSSDEGELWMLLNLDPGASIEIEGLSGQQWLLEGELSAEGITLNGELLEASDPLPPMDPVEVRQVVLPPRSIAFVR